MRGDRLKQIREERQMSQQDLADRTSISVKQIWRYENGSSDPTSDALVSMAKALEVSIDYLVGLVNTPTDHYREDELSAMERLLIRAVREGRIVEALKTFTTISEEVDKPHVVSD